MNKVEKLSNGLTVASEYFCPIATLECGQLFRYSKQNHVYSLISGDKKCTLMTVSQSHIPKELQDKQEALCSNTIFTNIFTTDPDYFYDYFDLATDYGKIVSDLQRFDELKDATRLGRGIHIVRGQLFETIISFIISANNNIPRIQGIIERLVAKYGTKMDGFYAFPTPNQLKDARADDYKALGAGYRADYLKSTVRTLLESDILDRLSTLSYADSLKVLLSLKGVGRKVADCICLFALGHTECYPADVWITKAEGSKTADCARRQGMAKYGSLAGYAQQYKFYHHIATKK